ncbi:hypothetical protein B0H34DRAFT_657558, partial [Crassisporium funariophilum]
LLHVVAVGFTLVRLRHHWQTGRMWCDDYLVLVPLITDCLYIIIIWLRFRDGSTCRCTLGFVYSTWFITLMFYTVIWTSRMCVALSIARIFPIAHQYRKFALGLVVMFALIYIGSLLLVTLTCRSSSTSAPWYNIQINDCYKTHTGHRVGTFVMEFASDILLIISPLFMLWGIKLPPSQRRLVLALFSTSIITLFSAIPYAVTWYFGVHLGPGYIIVIAFTPMLQTATSLLVCNLLIVSMLFYRIFKKELDPYVLEANVVCGTRVQVGGDDKPPIPASHSTHGLSAARPTRPLPSYTIMTFTSIYEEESLPISTPINTNNNTLEQFSSCGENPGTGSHAIVPPWTFSEKSVGDAP